MCVCMFSVVKANAMQDTFKLKRVEKKKTSVFFHNPILLPHLSALPFYFQNDYVFMRVD